MGLETVTFITDLVSTNPTASDSKSQGDDHLRAIKTAVQGSFPASSKAWYNPTTLSKTADFTVTAAQMNCLFLVSTAAGTVTATLPSLAAGDAGWECCFIKTNTGLNSFWIAPASGTLQSGDLSGLAKTRRVIPGKRCTAIWTGAAWFVTRNVDVPVATVLDFSSTATLPVGFEYPNGQTLAGASGSVYPDYFAKVGGLITADLRGRASFGSDLGGSASGRITTGASGIDGTTVGSAGGGDTVLLLRANLGSAWTFTNSGIALSGSVTALMNVNNSSNSQSAPSGRYLANVAGGTPNIYHTAKDGANSLAADAIAVTSTIAVGSQGTAAAGGSDTPIHNMPPCLIMSKILVVE